MNNLEKITIAEQIETLEYYLLFAETNDDVISLNAQIDALLTQS